MIQKFNLITFSKRLISFRKEIGLTQAYLSIITGIPRYTISKYETMIRAPSIANLYIIAQALNVSMDYLVGLSDDSRRII